MRVDDVRPPVSVIVVAVPVSGVGRAVVGGGGGGGGGPLVGGGGAVVGGALVGRGGPVGKQNTSFDIFLKQ